jgi:hypothetical protein
MIGLHIIFIEKFGVTELVRTVFLNRSFTAVFKNSYNWLSYEPNEFVMFNLIKIDFNIIIPPTPISPIFSIPMPPKYLSL